MEKSKDISFLLKQEREALSYTLKEVSQKMGFQNYQILSNIESGQRDIKVWELSKLAEIYGRDINFFMSGKTEPSHTKILWRDPKQTEDKTKVERQFITLCQNYKKLLDLTNEEHTALSIATVPAPNKQEFTNRGFSYVLELAEYYRKILDLGGRPAYVISRKLEQDLDVLVLYLDLGITGSGASTASDFGKAILINSNDAPWRRNYDLAHEFFHLITWEIFSDEEIYPKSKDGKSKVEQWADAFASAVLLPVEEVSREFSKKLIDNKITYLSLVEIAREFDVSIDALLWRLVNLRHLRKKDVEKCVQEEGIRKIDKEMRQTNIADQRPYISSRYITLAIKAMQMGKISKAKFAEYVNKPFSEISSFVKKYGYTENEDYSIVFTAS